MNSQPTLDDVLGPPANAGASPSLKPDTGLAVEFLDNIDRGRHDLFAIDSYGSRREARTILGGQRDGARKWIEDHQGQWNLYYTVNGAAENAPRNTRLAYNEARREIGRRRAFVADLDVKKLDSVRSDRL